MGRPLLRDEVPVGPCKVRAIYSWSGESPQDLGFVEGDIIEVLNNGDGDWWTGKLRRNKQVGIFPRNFAEYVDQAQQTMPSTMKGNKRQKAQLVDYHLETDPIDFATINLGELTIGEAPHAEEKRLKPSDIVRASANSLDESVSTSPKKALKESIGSNLGSSTQSKKSTKEILDDIEQEINRKFLDDINLDAHTEDFKINTEENDSPPVPPAHRSLQSSLNSERSRKLSSHVTNGLGQSIRSKNSTRSNCSTRSKSQSLVPEFPISADHQPKKSSSDIAKESESHGDHPELSKGNGIHDHIKDSQINVLPTSSDNASLDLSFPAASPLLDQEIPFDAKAFKPEMPIGDHIGSHFDTGYTSTMDTSSTVPRKNSLLYGGVSTRTSVVSKAAESSTTGLFKDSNSSKPSFFQKLFPKNSQNLRRKFSRSSHKSTKSTTPLSSKLRNVKSIFSISPDSQNEKIASTKSLVSSGHSHTLSGTNVPIISGRTETKGDSGFGRVSATSAISSKPNSFVKPGQPELFSKPSNSSAGGKWIESRRDLYRAQSLTERDNRKRRQELELQGINCENLVENLSLHHASDFHDYRLESFEEVDHAVLTMSTWPQLMTPSVFASSRIGRHFKDPVERVRAVFLLCGTRITHVDQTQPNNNVMQTRQATAKELAETVNSMCSALDIECDIIEGHIRQSLSGQQAIISRPHTWNAVKINDEWRMLDPVTAAVDRYNATNPMSSSGNLHLDLTNNSEDDDFVNLFYFLTPPSQLLFSHVPLDHRKQFCSPPLPTATAALLPLASPAAFAHNILFDEFWLGNTRLTDLEVCQIHLRVPNHDIDLVAFVDGKQVLAQAFIKDKQRLCRIKAFVPPRAKQALMKIYVAPKSQTNRDPRNLELIWTLEMRHSGGSQNNAPYEFVVRHAAPSVSQYDMYVIEPQCRGLTGGDTYTFKIESFEAVPNENLKQPHLAIQSPSGRLTRLVPFGTDVHETFRTNVKTMEVGTWRAVARADDNRGWVPFAEWFCS